MTGRKSSKAKKKATGPQQQQQQPPPPPRQPQAKQEQQQQPQPQALEEDTTSSMPANIKKEQPAPPQTVKKILKAENDEAKLLKTVFKSNPDMQIKDFIKKSTVKPNTNQQAVKVALKTPADTHPPAVAQELLDTDDDVADNLGKLFKASKSYKNL